jgi:hypothetical protein
MHRLFWILLAKGWQDCPSALIVVRPDTVVRWHRPQRFEAIVFVTASAQDISARSRDRARGFNG